MGIPRFHTFKAGCLGTDYPPPKTKGADNMSANKGTLLPGGIGVNEAADELQTLEAEWADKPMVPVAVQERISLLRAKTGQANTDTGDKGAGHAGTLLPTSV